eukprot:SAG22_NODE_488_length_9853_cov_2.555054_2_plen_75_part_00
MPEPAAPAARARRRPVHWHTRAGESLSALRTNCRMRAAAVAAAAALTFLSAGQLCVTPAGATTCDIFKAGGTPW